MLFQRWREVQHTIMLCWMISDIFWKLASSLKHQREKGLWMVSRSMVGTLSCKKKKCQKDCASGRARLSHYFPVLNRCNCAVMAVLVSIEVFVPSWAAKTFKQETTDLSLWINGVSSVTEDAHVMGSHIHWKGTYTNCHLMIMRPELVDWYIIWLQSTLHQVCLAKQDTVRVANLMACLLGCSPQILTSTCTTQKCFWWRHSCSKGWLQRIKQGLLLWILWGQSHWFWADSPKNYMPMHMPSVPSTKKSPILPDRLVWSTSVSC